MKHSKSSISKLLPAEIPVQCRVFQLLESGGFRDFFGGVQIPTLFASQKNMFFCRNSDGSGSEKYSDLHVSEVMLDSTCLNTASYSSIVFSSHTEKTFKSTSTQRDGARGRYVSEPRHRQEKKDKEWRRIVKALALIEAYP